jgi:hypothetical protein
MHQAVCAYTNQFHPINEASEESSRRLRVLAEFAGIERLISQSRTARYDVSTKPIVQQMGQPRKASSDTPAKANE